MMIGYVTVLLLTLSAAPSRIAASSSSPISSDTLKVEPWGPNAFRVRITTPGVPFNDAVPSALAHNPQLSESSSSTTNGDLQVHVDGHTGLLSFIRVSDGVVVLKEINRTVANTTARANNQSAAFAIAFEASPSDAIFGMGQGVPTWSYPTYRGQPFNRKGMLIDFEQCQSNEGGMANCLPWHLIVTNHTVQAGFLWNVPSFGGAYFGANATVWWATAAFQLDFVVMVPNRTDLGASRFDTLQRQYTAIIGRTKPLPDSLLGYWHSKNVYRTQAEVVDAMVGMRQRAIPVDVFVVDIGGSQGKVQGDWAFDPTQFPNPSNLTAFLAETGTRVMVSIWSGTDVNSTSWEALVNNEWVVRNRTAARDGQFVALPWPIGCSGPQCYLYDASNPDARAYVWSRVAAGFVAHGIDLFWLDASEPQPPNPGFYDNPDYELGQFRAGAMAEVGPAFTQWHTTTFADGYKQANLTQSVMLARSGWFGTAANGAALWSGDILSTWKSLRDSIVTGLGAQMSGIAWWTTDVGGYRCWDANDMPPSELVVRWFQFGLTCPLLRQHGRRPETVPWAYGPEAEKLIVDVIRQRVAMKDYIKAQHSLLASTGVPFNRPLWWDFPEDLHTWDEEVQGTQYMMGTEYLAAPVLEDGSRWRLVYLPGSPSANITWTHYYTNTTYPGGRQYNVSAPLEHFPLFRIDTASAGRRLASLAL
jgi:alpha-D-xyloside xylohydrolase